MGGQILLVESLATELVELDLVCEVATHYILYMLTDWRLEVVFIDLRQVFGTGWRGKKYIKDFRDFYG